MSAALRQVFAEFGFKVDSAKLEELDKLVRDSADHMRDSAAAAIDFDKAFKGKGPKSAADALKAWGLEDLLRRHHPEVHLLARRHLILDLLGRQAGGRAAGRGAGRGVRPLAGHRPGAGADQHLQACAVQAGLGLFTDFL